MAPSQIQELNYKITVALNSDARSEIEGLRWILTRRAAITIGVSAFFLFLALKYSSHVAHQNQLEDKKRKEQKKRDNPPDEKDDRNGKGNGSGNGIGNGNGNGNGVSASTTVLLASSGDQPLGGELLATEGGVSLG